MNEYVFLRLIILMTKFRIEKSRFIMIYTWRIRTLITVLFDWYLPFHILIITPIPWAILGYINGFLTKHLLINISFGVFFLNGIQTPESVMILLFGAAKLHWGMLNLSSGRLEDFIEIHLWYFERPARGHLLQVVVFKGFVDASAATALNVASLLVNWHVEFYRFFWVILVCVARNNLFSVGFLGALEGRNGARCSNRVHFGRYFLALD